MPLALALLAVLVIASLVSSFFLPLAGRRARPEHLVAPIALAMLVATQLVRRHRPIRVDAFSMLAAAWVGVNGLSSWLYAPQPAESFVHVVRMGFLAAIFLTAANLPFRHAGEWVSGFRLWLGLMGVELAYGVLVWSLAQYGDLWLPGAYVEPSLVGISIKGTLVERNLFGILAATALIVAVYCALAQRTEAGAVASRGVLGGVAALALVAVVVSLTRSAWLALVAVGPVAYVLFDRRRPSRGDRPLLAVSAGVPILLVAAIGAMRLVPAPADDVVARARAALPAGTAVSSTHDRPGATTPGGVTDRVASLRRLDTDFTTNTRIQDARWALADWRRSPVLGHGTGSFVQLHGMRAGSEAWISNLVLHTMVDTGLVGLAIQLSLVVLVCRRAWNAARLSRAPRLRVALKAMTLGVLVMVIAYQFTDGTWLAVFWVHLGLMVNGIYRVEQAEHAHEAPRSLSETMQEHPGTMS